MLPFDLKEELIKLKLDINFNKDPNLVVSNTQFKISKIINEVLGKETKLEYKIQNIYFDIFVEPNIIIEYDGYEHYKNNFHNPEQ